MAFCRGEVRLDLDDGERGKDRHTEDGDDPKDRDDRTPLSAGWMVCIIHRFHWARQEVARWWIGSVALG